MREIKFRAWDPSLGMLQVIRLAGDGSWLEVSHDNVTSFYTLDRERAELMQYTGLTDKNGVEIYEGDLVRYSTRDVLIVEYKAPAFTLRNPNAEGYWQWSVGLEGLAGG